MINRGCASPLDHKLFLCNVATMGGKHSMCETVLQFLGRSDNTVIKDSAWRLPGFMLQELLYIVCVYLPTA